MVERYILLICVFYLYFCISDSITLCSFQWKRRCCGDSVAEWSQHQWKECKKYLIILRETDDWERSEERGESEREEESDYWHLFCLWNISSHPSLIQQNDVCIISSYSLLPFISLSLPLSLVLLSASAPAPFFELFTLVFSLSLSLPLCVCFSLSPSPFFLFVSVSLSFSLSLSGHMIEWLLY